jgi:hypothetical protein
MRTLSVIAALLAVHAAAQAQTTGTSDSSALVRISEGGDFIEVERKADYSVVEVRRAPTGSVASSLFALKGACAVARARGEQFFSSTPITGSVPTHRLTFPRTAASDELRGPKKSVFALAECEMLRF